MFGRKSVSRRWGLIGEFIDFDVAIAERKRLDVSRT